MLNAIIIDDEELARATLNGFIEKYCPDVKIVGLAESATDGYKLINSKKPDVVFLDVEMPEKNGFDLLDMYETVDFNVIFTTAYGHYAIDAIKYSALDYILKPIDVEELKNAISKVKKIANTPCNINQVATLLNNLKQDDRFGQIVIPDTSGFKILNVQDIIFLKADGTYTEIVSEKEKIISSKNLKEYQHLLNSKQFFRVNKSYLINMNMITEYRKGEGGTVKMKSGDEIDVSRRRKSEFLAFFDTRNT